MRITGGILRGRRLAAFRGADIRPTSDRVREAIFNLLGSSLEGARVLDLFSGTGSLGIEALSRGAVLAMFIDHSFKAIELTKKNLKICGLEDSGVVLRKDLAAGEPFDHPSLMRGFSLVFLDPPYGKGLILPILHALQKGDFLAGTALVVAQSEKKQDLPDAVGNLKKGKARTYGSTRIIIFKHGEES